MTEVHDLHIWAMSTTETALTAHLVRAQRPATATPSCTRPARAWRTGSGSATRPCRSKPAAPAASRRPTWFERAGSPSTGCCTCRRRAAGGTPVAARPRASGARRTPRGSPSASATPAVARPGRPAGLAARRQRRREPLHPAADRAPARRAAGHRACWSPPAPSPRRRCWPSACRPASCTSSRRWTGRGVARRFLDHWRPDVGRVRRERALAQPARRPPRRGGRSSRCSRPGSPRTAPAAGRARRPRPGRCSAPSTCHAAGRRQRGAAAGAGRTDGRAGQPQARRRAADLRRRDSSPP